MVERRIWESANFIVEVTVRTKNVETSSAVQNRGDFKDDVRLGAKYFSDKLEANYDPNNRDRDSDGAPPAETSRAV